MDKFVGVILIVGLVIALYLGVFQDGLAPSVLDKGSEVEDVISTNNISNP